MEQIAKPSTHQLMSNTKSGYGRDTLLPSQRKRPKPTPTATSVTNAMLLR